MKADESMNTIPKMVVAEPTQISLESISELVNKSDIDFMSLKANIRAILQERTRASIAEILEQFPASQGLGTIVGYMDLGGRYGLRTERVVWYGIDKQQRSAKIPMFYFLREQEDELI